MIEFLFGYLFALLSVGGWLVARRAWRQAYGNPPEPPITAAQEQNRRYYEALHGSRGTWRSTRFARQIPRGKPQ